MNVNHVDLRLTEWICRVVSLALFHHLKGCVCCFRVLFEKKGHRGPLSATKIKGRADTEILRTLKRILTQMNYIAL